jgi:4-amino-4-deoxy-L-arabinose transferase-like glycosyltransferase
VKRNVLPEIGTSDPVVSSRQEKYLIAVVLAVAVLSRSAALWIYSENVADDRDSYLAIAQNVADEIGFTTTDADHPTAYRPPLYPLLLAVLLKLGGCPVAIGILQLLLGTTTVFLTAILGHRLGLGRASWFAALLVAVDPVSIQYTTFPMTETFFTFLVLLMLMILIRPHNSRGATPCGSAAVSRRLILLGLVFGVCALCRPTIWAYGLLVGAVWMRNAVRSGNGIRRQIPWSLLLSTTVVVSPWFIRNLVVFGEPILTTTHGGYTLLLGNNPVFYEEVVNRPWGTTWEAASPQQSQNSWIAGVQTEMDRQIGADATEPQRNRWMSRRAWRNISDNPGSFLRACRLRLCRFWNIAPQGLARRAVSSPVLWMIGLFYSVTGLGMLVGLIRFSRSEWKLWLLLIVLILSFTAMHLVYWSNMRMRTPLIPIVALLATRAVCSRRQPSTEPLIPAESTCEK